MEVKVRPWAAYDVFIELGEAVVAALKVMGHQASIAKRGEVSDECNFVLGSMNPQRFTIFPKESLKILYQTEQMGLPFYVHNRSVYNLSWDLILELWEYQVGLARKETKYCPLGYSEAFAKVPDNNLDKKETDIFIFGKETDRRIDHYNKAKKITDNILFLTNSFGSNRDSQIAKSKICLDIITGFLPLKKTPSGVLRAALVVCKGKALHLMEKGNGYCGNMLSEKHFIFFSDKNEMQNKLKKILENEDYRKGFVKNAKQHFMKYRKFEDYFKEATKGFLC